MLKKQKKNVTLKLLIKYICIGITVLAILVFAFSCQPLERVTSKIPSTLSRDIDYQGALSYLYKVSITKNSVTNELGQYQFVFNDIDNNIYETMDCFDENDNALTNNVNYRMYNFVLIDNNLYINSYNEKEFSSKISDSPIISRYISLTYHNSMYVIAFNNSAIITNIEERTMDGNHTEQYFPNSDIPISINDCEVLRIISMGSPLSIGDVWFSYDISEFLVKYECRAIDRDEMNNSVLSDCVVVEIDSPIPSKYWISNDNTIMRYTRQIDDDISIEYELIDYALGKVFLETFSDIDQQYVEATAQRSEPLSHFVN